MIVNVSATHTAIVTSAQMSRHDLLTWVNTTLKAEFTKVDELCTGAAYCQLMHSLYPKMVPIKRVKFCTNIEHEFIDNFRILQTVFQRLEVQKAIPIDRLVRGKFQDNIEFLQWFKKFYDANNEKRPYDPVSVRNGQPMAFGSAALTMKRKERQILPRSEVVQLQPQHSFRAEVTYQHEDSENDTYTLKRSLTRTELRHDLSGASTELIVKPQENFITLPVIEPLPPRHDLSGASTELIVKPQEYLITLPVIEPPPPEVNNSPASLTNASLKLDQILDLCLEAEAAGKKNVDLTTIKRIIFDQPISTETDLVNAAVLGAGDQLATKDIVQQD